MAENKFEMLGDKLAKRLIVQVTVRFSTMFRLRWFLFLSLLKILRRMCPIRVRVYQEPKPGKTLFSKYTEHDKIEALGGQSPTHLMKPRGK